jgi:ribonuclease P protein component
MLMLRYLPTIAGRPRFHVVLAVGRKLGKAHDRNRIKRRLRESLLQILKNRPADGQSFDIAIIPKQAVLHAEYLDLVSDLKSILNKNIREPR